MSKSKRHEILAAEQHVLEHGRLHLLASKEDIARCAQVLSEHHYLHDVTLVGEHLRYAFAYKGRWLAVATWSSAAFHIKDRDQFIGWTAEQCRRRRALLANNSRLLVLPDCHYPNLISRFMKLRLAQLSEDWQQRWGHPIARVETFVDPRFYRGTAYKLSGWSHLGKTAGGKRDADDFYEKNDAPKQIWVRELVRKACVKLRAPQLPDSWAKVQERRPPRCTAKAQEICGLMKTLEQEVPEFRRKEALAYPVAGLICLVVMAMAQGVVRGPTDLARYADTLSPAQLRALKFRRNPNTGRIRCPRKTVFTTLLQQLDDQLIERLRLRWQAQILGPAQDRIVIVEGKKVRHAGVEIVNAIDSQGRFLGSVLTESKSNEIPAARLLLRGQDLSGKLVLTDALHPNEQTAQQIRFESGGDCLRRVKGHQPKLQKHLETLFTQQSFPPSPDPSTRALKREHNRGRLEIRSRHCLEVTPRQVLFPGARRVARLETRVKRKEAHTKKRKWSREVVYLVSSLTLAELQAQGLLLLKRGYWIVESRLHHCLDITLREEASRVRTPKAARTLGTIRRVIVSLANAAVNHARKKNPKTKGNTATFLNRFKSARGGRERLHALITAKFPNVLNLQN